MVKLGWERMGCVFQCESSHAGRIKTIINVMLVMVDEQARACRTNFRMFSGSKSGTARLEAVHR